MNRLCPNCQYVRKPTDSAPEWQCPQCEIAYNKGAGAAMAEDYGRYASTAVIKPAASLGVAKWLVLLFVLGAAVWVGRSVWQPAAWMATPGAPLAGQPEVILYAIEWCGYCAATRDFSPLTVSAIRSWTSKNPVRLLRGIDVWAATECRSSWSAAPLFTGITKLNCGYCSVPG